MRTTRLGGFLAAFRFLEKCHHGQGEMQPMSQQTPQPARVKQDPGEKGFKVFTHAVPIPGSPLARVAGPCQDISPEDSSEGCSQKAKSMMTPGVGAAVKCQSCSRRLFS